SVFIDSSNATALTHLRGMINDPAGYYVNIHTTEFGGGIIRGQLEPANITVLMGAMNSDNEFPALTNDVKASGTALVIAVGTWNQSGNLPPASVYFPPTSPLSSAPPFTGFHLHPGLPGTAGPVAIGSNLPAGVAADANTNGLVNVADPTEINLANALQV